MMELFQKKVPVWATAVLAFLSWAVPHFGAPYFQKILSIEVEDHNRVAQLRLEDYRKLTGEQQQFHQMLQAYTADLMNMKPANKEEKSQMTASLVRQYDDIRQFRVYIDPQYHQSLADYQSSLNELRKQLDKTNTKSDLNDFYLVFRRNVELAKALAPILEQAVGKGALSQAAL